MHAALLVWLWPLLPITPNVALSEAPLLEAPPQPLSAPPERARRWFELGPELGVAIPHCESAAGSSCAALGAGPEVGVSALLRPTPTFAFGVEARRLAFELDDGEHGGSTRASALFAGLVGRLYLLQSEMLDPYLDLTLGAGSLSLASSERGVSARENANLSFAMRSSAGLDLLPNDWLRVGAYFSILRYFPGSVLHCDGALCGAVPARAAWSPLGATTLGVRVSVAAGELL